MSSASRRSARGLGAGRALVGLGCGLGLVAMARVVPEDSTSAAMLALLLLLPLALADAVLPVVDAGTIAVRTRFATRRLAALTGASPIVTDPEVPTALPSGRPTLEVRDVTAGWAEEDAVTRLVSHSLAPVGGSDWSDRPARASRRWRPCSSGSSTRDRGRSLLAGVDLRALALDDVRREVGLVDDDPYVFASTLAENVRLARPAAEDAEVAAALRAAQLGPWLDLLPDGLLTLVGEGHHQVSGGERARLGIARAILADQPILVLDEPTAHLDTSTAQAVADDLLTASGGRSVLWITHGTVGLEAMDHVIRLVGEPHGERVSRVP